MQSQQLEWISEVLLHRFGLWRQLDRVDLDIDSTGLMVYGNTYEGMRSLPANCGIPPCGGDHVRPTIVVSFLSARPRGAWSPGR